MPIDIKGKKYYTAIEVARAVGISRQTLWRWRHAGRVPSGRRYRDQQLVFTEEELEAVRQYANRLGPSETTGIVPKTLSTLPHRMPMHSLSPERSDTSGTDTTTGQPEAYNEEE